MRKTWKQISAFLLAMLLTVSLGTAAAFASESEAKSGPLGIISAMDVELKKLVEEKGYCVIVVTHDLGIAQQADVVYRMKDGEISLEKAAD